MELGMMVTINQRLDKETISIVADEFGYEVKAVDDIIENNIIEEDDDDSNLEKRAPVVTIMGHVDHGKTSILDYIRKTRVVQGEAGGITQHIGAYSVSTEKGEVTFLDTPGHEAFSAMRSRGAQVTDVIVLVVAADSRVMPQTKEAIEHAKSAKVQLVVAINKCDLPTSNPDSVKSQLAEAGVQVDSYGGEVSCVEVSAKTGHNIDKLLEILAIETEILELKANPNTVARGTVIEVLMDKGKGIVPTVIIQNGSLSIGEHFVCGSYSGKVRSLFDDKGKQIKLAGPSMPVQILGLSGMPQSGDSLMVVETEQKAKELAGHRFEVAKERERRQKKHITLDQLHEQIESGEFHELKLIVKADVDGSLEAIATSLDRLSTDKVIINIIHKEVGALKESDIQLASVSDALVIVFHLLPSEKIRRLAENEGIEIEYFRTIYEVVESVQGAMEGMLDPQLIEEVVGEASVLQIFKVPKVGFIAGVVVKSGTVDRESFVRLYREGIEIGEAKITSLKRLKEDVKAVKNGLECGIGIANLQDIQEGDTLAFFKKKQVAQKLNRK